MVELEHVLNLISPLLPNGLASRFYFANDDASGEQNQRSSSNHPYPNQSAAPYTTSSRQGHTPRTPRRSPSRIQPHQLLHPIQSSRSRRRFLPSNPSPEEKPLLLEHDPLRSLQIQEPPRKLTVLENGVLVHGLAVKNGLDKDGYVAPSLVEMYGEFGRVEDARKVFDEITLKSSVLWGVLMKGYLRYSSDSEVFRLFYLMREERRQVGARFIHQKGFIDQSGYLQASVVDMYVKCRLLDDARELFQKSVDKNVVMWTTLVSGFAKCERAVEAFDLFRR
ncbi:hypothetical protein Bca52824_070933 [Brassica carinata]|uniref:Pentatricopeptide repeat-containing protein n=1 Tax=Brassica carinata TaxID=52824 RepID=A0A8X7Q4U3_BRACI|nr:hypothetical protein Bca52824_070933 [Brassica carinata]